MNIYYFFTFYMILKNETFMVWAYFVKKNPAFAGLFNVSS